MRNKKSWCDQIRFNYAIAWGVLSKTINSVIPGVLIKYTCFFWYLAWTFLTDRIWNSVKNAKKLPEGQIIFIWGRTWDLSRNKKLFASRSNCYRQWIFWIWFWCWDRVYFKHYFLLPWKLDHLITSATKTQVFFLNFEKTLLCAVFSSNQYSQGVKTILNNFQLI